MADKARRWGADEMPHLKMWEIMERAAEGPFCEDETFLYEIFLPKMKQVVRKYDIKYDPALPVPADDDLADRVWQAAVEFFLAVGVHNVDTHRRILISEAELREALYLAPEQHVVGAGHETRFWQPRKVEDARPPFCIFSPDITYDEDIFLQASMAYVQEPLADGVCGPILEESIGINIKSGTPSEMAGVMEHAMLLRNAAKLVGPARPVPRRGGHGPVGRRPDRGQQQRVGRALYRRPPDRRAHRDEDRQRAAEQGGPLQAVRLRHRLPHRRHLRRLRRRRRGHRHPRDGPPPGRPHGLPAQLQQQLPVPHAVHVQQRPRDAVAGEHGAPGAGPQQPHPFYLQRLLQRRPGHRNGLLRGRGPRHRQHRLRRRPVDRGPAAQQVPQLRHAARGAPGLRGRPRGGATEHDARARPTRSSSSSSASTKTRSPRRPRASPSRSATRS